MKKFLVMALSIMTMLLLTACGKTSQPAETSEKPSEGYSSAENAPVTSGDKILVAYFSRAGDNYEVGIIEKGNTAIVAEMIAQTTGADLFEIKTVKDYPADYRECTEVAKQEQAENARPELAAKVENLQDYNTIFLGFPIWWSDMPMALYTFLENQDFNGKTIIPFCTSAGEYMTGKESSIPEIAKGSTVREGIGLKGKTCQENPEEIRVKLNTWLGNLGY